MLKEAASLGKKVALVDLQFPPPVLSIEEESTSPRSYTNDDDANDKKDKDKVGSWKDYASELGKQLAYQSALLLRMKEDGWLLASLIFSQNKKMLYIVDSIEDKKVSNLTNGHVHSHAYRDGALVSTTSPPPKNTQPLEWPKFAERAVAEARKLIDADTREIKYNSNV
jgi:hypothetical protein